MPAEKSVVAEHKAMIRHVQPLNQQSTVLTLVAPEIAAAALPGQFVQVSCNHFLRRPIGIMAVDVNRGFIRLGIRIQGDGTRWLAGRQPGETLSLLGPLGHGFTLDGYERIITVGGGSGVFPLFFVQQVCRARGIDALAVCGYRSREESVLRDEYSQLGCQTLFAADAGDLDVPGHAAAALEQSLENMQPLAATAILTCGPRPMMQAVAATARQHNLPCQVSLEERMACGFGVCLVCACKVKRKQGDDGSSAEAKTAEAQEPQANSEYRRCCVDGPVFAAEEVIW